MLWKLALQGVVVLARDLAGFGVIPVALEVVGVLVSIMTIVGAADRRTEAQTILKDWRSTRLLIASSLPRSRCRRERRAPEPSPWRHCRSNPPGSCRWESAG